jgi:hypothetical protein
MSWRLAKSLIKLREQINMLHPNRSKVSDGSVGDPRHQRSGSASDHNPHIKDAQRVGVVTAIDVTNDPSHGVFGDALSEQLIRDPRVKYVIWNKRIWKARTGKWEAYRGPNPHTKHVHVSVKPENYDNDMAWILDSEAPTKPLRPTLKRGDRGPYVQTLQVALGIEADGIFGPNTERRVREFQEKHGLMVDGRVGEATWRALG